jgi:arylsulfatase A-like enzyme
LGNQQALRVGDWTLVRIWNAKTKKPHLGLFNIREDLGETTNVADKHPELLARMTEKMNQARTPSAVFPNPLYDQPASD